MTGERLRLHTFAAQSASMRMQAPMNSGSATRQRMLSTQYTWKYFTPRAFTSLRCGRIAA